MDFYKEIVCREISKNDTNLTQISNQIWSFAETGYEAHKSCDTICKFLEKNAFKVIREFKGIKSTFIAEYGKAKRGTKRGVNVAILCRYDAVPRKGHVMGTNLCAEVAIGAALGLKAVISSTADKLGKVTVIGCANLEGGGLIPLMRLRAFQGIDVLLAAAPGTRTEWHPLYFGCMDFNAVYYGSDGDPVEVQPPTNAMDAAILAYTKMLAMREHFGRGWKASGSVAMPGSIWVDRKMCQTVVKLVAPSNPELKFMKARMMPCLEAAAQSTGCKVNIKQDGYTMHCLISNIQLGYLLQLNAYHCGLLSTPKNTPQMSNPVDVAEVSRLIPTIRPFFYIGTNAKPGTEEFKEAARTSEAHCSAIAMAKALAMTAIDVLHTPGTLSKVKDDLARVLVEEEKETFAPFNVKSASANGYLVKTELPADNGYVGWNRLV